MQNTNHLQLTILTQVSSFSLLELPCCGTEEGQAPLCPPLEEPVCWDRAVTCWSSYVPCISIVNFPSNYIPQLLSRGPIAEMGDLGDGNSH